MKFNFVMILISLILLSSSLLGQSNIQDVFHSGLKEYCIFYENQKNEIKASGVYTHANKTKETIAQKLGWSFSNWNGYIVEISTNQGGEWADLRITSDVNDFTIGFVDRRILGEGGLKKGTKIYDQLSQLKERDPVVFSGQFIRGERGIKELSLTERGSLCSPEFSVKFTELSFNPDGQELTTSSDAFWRGFSESFDWMWNYKWWLIGGFVVINIIRGVAQNRKLHNVPSTKSRTEYIHLITCPYCQSRVSVDSLHCENCGRKVQGSCKNCEGLIGMNTKYCPTCGKEQT